MWSSFMVPEKTPELSRGVPLLTTDPIPRPGPASLSDDTGAGAGVTTA